MYFLGVVFAEQKLPIAGDENIMAPKTHGTSEKPVQQDLLWDCDNATADRYEFFC